MTVAIAGIAELPQGRMTNRTPMELHETLVRRALADANLALQDVDAILTVSPRSDPYLIHATALAEHLHIQPPITFTLEAGGGGPMAMVEMARGFIEGGSARVVVIVAADMPLGAISRKDYIHALAEVGPVHPDTEVPFGPSVPSMFGIVANCHAEEFGTNESHFGAVAIQNRQAAARHPNAHIREPITMEDYLASPMIASPLRRLDCAVVSDGGGALVVVGMEHARDLTAAPVKVLSTGFSSGHMHLSTAQKLTAFAAGDALDRALARAAIDRDAIDLALVYDCFTIAMLVNIEDLGFAKKGEAGPAFLAGEFGPTGRLPVNTHGGLLSHGHPARGGGFSNLIEAIVQLRRQAGGRQVPEVEIAMAHGMGGVFATHGVILLGRP